MLDHSLTVRASHWRAYVALPDFMETKCCKSANWYERDAKLVAKLADWCYKGCEEKLKKV